jgi:putative tryptophan/tyrosine transport system substrate-binding protein
MLDLKRREFITLVGGAAVAWPLAARAQQPKLIRLGYLEPGMPTDLVAANLRRQFLLGLRDLGYIEGRHFKMEDRSAEGRLDRLPALATELARMPVDMFVVGGEAPIRAAMQASDKIPIVMTLAADPVGSGFVASLAHPGGNATGMSALAPDLAAKRMELLKEVISGRCARCGAMEFEQPVKSRRVEGHAGRGAYLRADLALARGALARGTRRRTGGDPA